MPNMIGWMNESRNALNELRSTMGVELNNAITLLNERLFYEEWQLHQISSMWKTLDAINICRPCPRDYTIALALADRKKAELVPQRKHNNNKGESGGGNGAATGDAKGSRVQIQAKGSGLGGGIRSCTLISR
jgi:hypothetical protein